MATIQDVTTAKLMQRREFFADAFNFSTFGGRQVIQPGQLIEQDTKKLALPYGGAKGASFPQGKFRDVLKEAILMTDPFRAYLLLGTENQSSILYAAPMKNMMYDSLLYGDQVTNAINSHKESGDYKESGSDEYLSGFMKSDRLIPVITLMIYWKPGKWDGPRTIHEMFDGTQPPEVLQYVPDYRINLLSPYELTDGDFPKFRTTLREILQYIKYSEDKNRLMQVTREESGFRPLGRDEVDLLNACAGAKIKMEQGEEEVQVNKAIRDLLADATAQATEQATAETTVRVTVQVTAHAVKSLMDEMKWTSEKSMDVLHVSPEDRMLVQALL